MENRKPISNAMVRGWSTLLQFLVTPRLVVFIFIPSTAHTRQILLTDIQTGLVLDHEISRVSIRLRVHWPDNNRIVLHCILIISPCLAFFGTGFPLARRIGHPYQQRTPPKRKKPRTSFTRLQVNYKINWKKNGKMLCAVGLN